MFLLKMNTGTRNVSDDQAMSSQLSSTSLPAPVISPDMVIWQSLATCERQSKVGRKGSDKCKSGPQHLFFMDNIIQWNINDCSLNCCELNMLLARHTPMCVGITSEIRDFKMRGYESFRFDITPTSGGGVAVFLSNTYPARRIPLVTPQGLSLIHIYYIICLSLI